MPVGWPSGRCCSGLCLPCKRRQYDQAIPHFIDLLRITGEKNFPVQVNLGNCYAHLGKYEKALEHYSIALQIDPDHEKVIMNMKLAQQRMKSAGK